MNASSHAEKAGMPLEKTAFPPRRRNRLFLKGGWVFSGLSAGWLTAKFAGWLGSRRKMRP
uniref:hypothetical protein n=1 Tax=Candidatus Electronema sp. TaxID=2698783 RepID=UPI004057AAAF